VAFLAKASGRISASCRCEGTELIDPLRCAACAKQQREQYACCPNGYSIIHESKVLASYGRVINFVGYGSFLSCIVYYIRDKYFSEGNNRRISWKTRLKKCERRYEAAMVDMVLKKLSGLNLGFEIYLFEDGADFQACRQWAREDDGASFGVYFPCMLFRL